MEEIESGKASRLPELVALVGKNVNHTSSTGDTPLIHVIKYSNTNDKKHLKMLKAIIDSPFIDVNQAHHHVHNTPLHYLVSKNQYDNQGAEPLTAESKGVHVISNDIHLKMMHQLIKNDMKNRNGDTPLHIAADHGDVTAVRLLVSLDNIKLHLKDGNGKTAAELAEDQGHVTVAEILRTAAKNPPPSATTS